MAVTVRLRPRIPLPKSSSLLTPTAAPRSILSHRQYNELYGATKRDIDQIKQFADSHNLAIVNASQSRRSVTLFGTVENFEEAFGIQLMRYRYSDDRTYRGRTGYVRIPKNLAHIIEGVFGLDDRPVAKRARAPKPNTAAAPDCPGVFSSIKVAELYGFPPDADGYGQTIGIIELGGGYRRRDLHAYFKRLHLAVPQVITKSVDHGSNRPRDDASNEVALDIQVAGAVAPGAKIVVYFSARDRSSDAFLDAVTTAIHDEDNNPSVIAISWGYPEEAPSASFLRQFGQALQTAAMLGITVCVASGDDGAAGRGPKNWRDGEAHVNFPASNPFALACGGTLLLANGDDIAQEFVWNQGCDIEVGDDGSFRSSGGGVSEIFPLPAYQKNARVPSSRNTGRHKGRGVPDVAGNADPRSGYKIFIDGKESASGGTSAVAPLWAGLIARINQKLGGRVGFINPQIYSLKSDSGAFRDITGGDNRCTYGKFQKVGYDARPGWDPCTGLGSPNGIKLCDLLKPAPTIRNSRNR
jgi:kumamolisin